MSVEFFLLVRCPLACNKKFLKFFFHVLFFHKKMDADQKLRYHSLKYGGCSCTGDSFPVNKRVRAQLGTGFGTTSSYSSAVVPYAGSSLAAIPSGGSYTPEGVVGAGSAGSEFPLYATIGGIAGTAAGKPQLGYAAGSLLDAVGGLTGVYEGGKSAYQGFKGMVGWGDYSLRTNSLVRGGGVVGSNLKIMPMGERAVRIVYREYIGDVFTHPDTAGAFFLKGYPLNPGLLSTFKWLPAIAQQFEQWTPNGLVFEFKSTSSEYVSTQALGSVIMATEYDQLDAPYANKIEMLNSSYSNEAKPSEHIVHGVECDPRDNPMSIFYVRSGAAPGDIRDYDLGTFYVATQGGATANLNLGSLYVHYDFTFRKEQLYNGVFARGVLGKSFTLNDVAIATPFGGAAPTVNFDNVGADLHAVGSRLSFPTWTAGARWLVAYRLGGTPGSTYSEATFSASNGGGLAVSYPTTLPPSNGNVIGLVYVMQFTQNRPDSYLNCSLSSGFTGNFTGQLAVCQVSSEFKF